MIKDVIQNGIDNNIIKECSNGYARNANPRRGYHSYDYIVLFNDDVDVDSQRKFMVEMVKTIASDCFYMWCTQPKKLDINKWVINYGYDSGD